MTTKIRGKLILILHIIFIHTQISPMPKSTISWKSLEKSNAQFVKNGTRARERARVKDAQQPQCIILGCSDSRVPPEIIFNQALGKLFVVRVAGHVVDDVVIDSIEFTIRNFGSSLLIILGHSDCGAVSGALKHLQANGGILDTPRDHLGAVLIPIERAIMNAGIAIHNPHALAQATQANMHYMAEQLMSRSTSINQAVKTGKLTILGAEYFLESGKVTKLFSIDC